MRSADEIRADLTILATRFVTGDAPKEYARHRLAADVEPLLDENTFLRARAERAERRCWAPHPDNPTVVDCILDRGHDGDHWSSTGCAGSETGWARAVLTERPS